MRRATPPAVSGFSRTVSRTQLSFIGAPVPAALVLLIAFVLVCQTGVRTDDPISSNVRYTGEIIRIFERRCLACHDSNSLAMPLSTYRQVRDWGRAIREEIVEQRMPPWSVARGYARFQNDVALTSRETTTILSWLDGGMPRGDDRDLPRAAAAAPQQPPDLRLSIPAQHIPAGEEDVVRRVTVDTNLTAARRTARVAVTPGNHRVLRGALVFIDGGGRPAQWVGGWLPWQPRIAPAAPHSFNLPSGTRLTVELHYRGDDHDVQDSPTLDVYFAESAEAENDRRPRFGRAFIDELIVDGASALRLPAATTPWAIVPSGDRTTRSLELTARRPNGAVDVLLWMPEYRHEWPQALVLQDPITLPAGTTVTLVAEPRTAAAAARLSLLSGSPAGPRGLPGPPDAGTEPPAVPMRGSD
jgi:hypothetical protein